MLEPSPVRVPIADPALDSAADRDRIVAAIERVIAGGSYILGREVEAFEARMAGRLRVPAAVGVGSGTEALVLALKALAIGPGDEVVTVSHTAGPTVAAICLVGATPVLIEVEAETFCLDPTKLEAAIGPRTKAVLVVHLYGHPADMERIGAIARTHNLPVIEDCAQAQEASVDGRPVGSIGALSCFSFYPTKTLGALGDGGLVAAGDVALAERVRQLRTYGWTKPQYAEIPGGQCSRLDELQAAILNVKLDTIEAMIGVRRAFADRYAKELGDLPLVLPVERPRCRHVYHLYVVRSDRRDALARHLNAAGISTARHYPYPVHVQPAFAGARIPEPLTVTERLAGEILTLPLFPSLRDDQQAWVISAIRDFFGRA